MEYEGKRKKCKTILLVITLVIIVCSAFVLYLLAKDNRGNPGNVAMMFVKAMSKNDQELAKSLVAPEAWEEIDVWVEKHQVFNCASWGVDAVGFNNPETDTPWNVIATTYCNDDDKFYCFGIADIVVEKLEEGWIITKWGNICEINNYCLECDYR